MGSLGMERRGWRSPGHWLGAGGLAFILWAWIDSGWYTSDLSYYHDTRQVSLTQYHGEWIFTRSETPSNRSWPGRYVNPSRSPSSPPGAEMWRIGRLGLPLPVTPMTVDRLLDETKPHLGKLHQFSIGIAHWFAAAIYIAVWLVVHARLRRRQLPLT
jgi:hypothetical protein